MLYIPAYIQQKLKKARYEYDNEAKVWCTWVPGLAGAYAQADTVEQARETLAEVLEEYIIVSLQNKKDRTLLSKIKQAYACA